MKNIFAQLFFISTKIQKQHIQLFFLLLALVALVLGSGAPDSGGGVSGPH